MSVGGVAVLGSVLLDAVDPDNPNHTAVITSKPVEDGRDIADHMKLNPVELNITGVITGPDAWPRLARIRAYQDNSELVTYTNRVIYSNMAITGINTEHAADIAGGLRFTITMKHARTARPVRVQVSLPAPAATKAAPAGNAGTQQVRPTGKTANNKAVDTRMAAIAVALNNADTDRMT